MNTVALLAGKFFGWSWLDPVMGTVGSAVVAVWAWGYRRRLTRRGLTSIQSRFTDMNESVPANTTAHREGPVARAIETQTAKLPSDTFLWAALASIGLSLSLKFAGRKHDALFVGQWAPTFLLFGIYNKLVKLHGSDKNDA